MSDDERIAIETDISDQEQRGNISFPIVGVGASAGGLNAFIELLSGLPDNTGMAFVLVQHLDPNHASNLSEILSRVTSIPVLDASQDLAVRANHIYVIPPNTSLTIAQGKLRLAPRGESRQLHLPIDHFLIACCGAPNPRHSRNPLGQRDGWDGWGGGSQGRGRYHNGPE